MADPIDPKEEQVLQDAGEMDNVETGYMPEPAGTTPPQDWQEKAQAQRVREKFTTGKVSPFVEGTFNPADSNPNMTARPTREDLKQQYINRQQGNTTLKPETPK